MNKNFFKKTFVDPRVIITVLLYGTSLYQGLRVSDGFDGLGYVILFALPFIPLFCVSLICYVFGMYSDPINKISRFTKVSRSISFMSLGAFLIAIGSINTDYDEPFNDAIVISGAVIWILLLIIIVADERKNETARNILKVPLGELLARGFEWFMGIIGLGFDEKE